MASQAQTLANQQNSLNSTGPRTPEGKSRSSQNSFKHGLTANVVVLPTEDQAVYQEFCRGLLADYEPLGAMEEQYAQTAIDAKWRIHRIAAIENNLFALAQFEPVPEHLAHIEDPQTLAALIQAHAFIKYERQIRNLNLQEQRLHRIARRALDDLATLQELRASQASEQDTEPEGNEKPAAKIGFDFANPYTHAKTTAPNPAGPTSETAVLSSAA